MRGNSYLYISSQLVHINYERKSANVFKAYPLVSEGCKVQNTADEIITNMRNYPTMAQ